MNKLFSFVLISVFATTVAFAEGRQQIRYLVCQGQTAEGVPFRYSQCVRTIESEVGYFNDCANHFQLEENWLRQLIVNGAPKPSAFASVLNITDLSAGGVSVSGEGVNDRQAEVLRIQFTPGSADNVLRVGNYENDEIMNATPESVTCEIQ